jgi:muconate cycloisomerase
METEKTMRIERITTRPLFLPYAQTFHWAHGVIEGAEIVLVEIETDSGIVGYGESIGGPSGHAIKRLMDLAAGLMIGRDPFAHRTLWHEAYTALFRAQGTCSAPRFGAQILAGLEMALWDVMGKATGRAACTLLGGARHEKVGYHGFAMGDSTEELAADAAELVHQGFPILYFKAGFGAEQDIANVAAVRDVAGPDARLRIDPNEAWSVLETRRMMDLLAPYRLEFIEQPTDAESLSALQQVRQHSTVGIAADQLVFSPEDAEAVCAVQAADLIVIGPHETGGLARLADVARIAQRHGLNICLHGLYESGITTCAAHQVGVSCPNLDDGNQHMIKFLEFDLLSSPDIQPQAGFLPRLEGPGLGFELDRDAVREAERIFVSRNPD